ncbi:non-hydrolyzing UDP-N-acetylglucosamine 2-epimerase [Legionella jamestowniensis]|uniref:UDP-N-acetylglucosamine 2-epimerase (non-hydrolyzing) n=1 Tax=Legionella jamestowniensis TaxID=455 RepID=A0A0W0UG68_9GAMM|nr:UDP-N-acetylglucosamine 2-epimerase (non-hydrolyzing) [Legionella jamestowniensis]KTD06826.1 UDP-N-acetylglucosamine 2-epimerase [Legionella jamestowniensis]SFL82625.1 UDP-N-acetylglucosamine 2-epimerase (non-hydrolysing) [Legionella jamestowniensis DSM 19215]
MISTLTVFGTRPEAIKLAPLIKEFALHPTINNKICITGQHQQMLMPVLDLFNIKPDFNLDVMSINQSLTALTIKILSGIEELLKKYRPNLILVHGDTTTTFAATLAAYYHQIPVAHIEAGLRSGNINSPWPEEANRKLTATLADIHFAPTQLACDNLLREGVSSKKIHVTGNTVVDALFHMIKKIDLEPELNEQLAKHFPFLNPSRKVILITGHRRENFGKGVERICQAIKQIALNFPEVDLVYPVHLNPNILQPVNSLLKGISNVHLIEPVNYLPFIYLMKWCYIILTDSGGIQEEAPSLGKPVLVMRDTTERLEAIIAGTVKLVGSSVENIVNAVCELLTDKQTYLRMSEAKNPYGDGYAAARIVNLISEMHFEKLPHSTAPQEVAKYEHIKKEEILL